MVRDFDHGVGGGRVDVDCGSWSLAGGGLAAAHEARLLGDIAKVLSVAIAPRRRNCQRALIDAHLIGAAFIHLSNLRNTSAETFRKIYVCDLSAFGRQELG